MNVVIMWWKWCEELVDENFALPGNASPRGMRRRGNTWPRYDSSREILDNLHNELLCFPPQREWVVCRCQKNLPVKHLNILIPLVQYSSLSSFTSAWILAELTSFMKGKSCNSEGKDGVIYVNLIVCLLWYFSLTLLSDSEWPSLLSLIHWDHGFESRSMHECMTTFFCVVLSCIGICPAMGRSPFKWGKGKDVPVFFFLPEQYAIKAIGEWGIVPHILDPGTRWRWVVSFTPRPLYH